MKRLRAIYLILTLVVSVTFAVGTAYGAVVKQTVDEEIIANESARAVIRGSVIELSADTATKFEIFSITGQLIRSVNVPASAVVRVELAKGFYILKCDSWTRRVMIK